MLFHGGGPPPTGVTTFTHGIIYYCARYESLPHAVATVRRTDLSRIVTVHLRNCLRNRRVAFGVSIVYDYHRIEVEEEKVRRNGRPSKESQLELLSLSLSSTSRVCPLSRGRAIGIPRVSTRRPDIVGWRDLERERRSIAFSRVTRPLEAC